MVIRLIIIRGVEAEYYKQNHRADAMCTGFDFK